MNIVGLALPLLAQHGPINSSVDLDKLVRQLIDSFLPWEKFRRPGLKSCPNLAKADAVTLHVSSEVEPILDIGNTWKGQGEVDEEEGQVSGLPHLLDLVDNEEETHKNMLTNLFVIGDGEFNELCNSFSSNNSSSNESI